MYGLTVNCTIFLSGHPLIIDKIVGFLMNTLVSSPKQHLSKDMQHSLYIVRVICNDLITHYYSIQGLDLKDLIQVVIVDCVYYLLCTCCTKVRSIEKDTNVYAKYQVLKHSEPVLFFYLHITLLNGS